MIALTAAFTVFALWRLYRRKLDRVVEEREEFLPYPQTSPEIYSWLPYHKKPSGADPVSAGGREAPPGPPDSAGRRRSRRRAEERCMSLEA